MQRVSFERAAVALLVAANLACGKESTAPPGTPPEIVPLTSVSLSEVELLTLEVSATDPEGQPVALALFASPPFARLSDLGGGTGTLHLAPELGHAGNHRVVVSASDGSDRSFDTLSVAVASVPRVPGGLFYEPLSSCLTGAETGGAWTLFNRGDQALIFQPVDTIPGAQGLSERRVIDPRTALDVSWSWDPAAPFPVTDTLIALTNDPERPKVFLPLRREDPAGFVDILPPEPPVLATPPDGAIFQLAWSQEDSAFVADIPLAWSELDDCSGIERYHLQVSTGSSEPSFSQGIVFEAPGLPTAEALLVAEEGDDGVAYWRVRAVDREGLVGLFSEIRSWTVLGP